MGQSNLSRIQVREGAYSFQGDDLAVVLKEIDRSLRERDVYSTVTRTTGLISRVDYFSDVAKTVLIMRRDFTRATGFAGIKFISSVVSTFYNDDGGVDSAVTVTLTRDTNANKNVILGMTGVFSTTEDPVP